MENLKRHLLSSIRRGPSCIDRNAQRHRRLLTFISTLKYKSATSLQALSSFIGFLFQPRNINPKYLCKLSCRSQVLYFNVEIEVRNKTATRIGSICYYACTYYNTCVCIYIYIHMCVYIHIYIYMYIYSCCCGLSCIDRKAQRPMKNVSPPSSARVACLLLLLSSLLFMVLSLCIHICTCIYLSLSLYIYIYTNLTVTMIIIMLLVMSSNPGVMAYIDLDPTPPGAKLLGSGSIFRFLSFFKICFSGGNTTTTHESQTTNEQIRVWIHFSRSNL